MSGLLHATGIEFVIDDKKATYTKVKRDVIISCGTFISSAIFLLNKPLPHTGTFQSPQILELSGIGNPSILKKYEIETKIDLPGVGENLRVYP